MTPAVWFFAALILIAALVLVVAWKVGRKRALSAAAAVRLKNEWKKVESIKDPHRRIMDAEKILDSAMKTLGYEGTFAEKLQSAGPRFSQLDLLWDAHRLRNRIAHEVGIAVSESDAKRTLQAFERAIKDLS
ncbi:MAG TPA: hypothetical protein VHA78_03385 [Candidatus Peribacteraceae bacterium]|nr:hypothetical protein [Candidatus Peribacteraceae bacterium]